MPPQDYLPLTRCAEDLLHLKATWDTVAAVLYTFADWCGCPPACSPVFF